MVLIIGSEKGDNIDKSFKFSKAVELKPGVNHISLLSMTVGLPVARYFLISISIKHINLSQFHGFRLYTYI